MIPLFFDNVSANKANEEAIFERLWAPPHRPGGAVVDGILDAGGGLSAMETVSRGGFRQERGWAVSMWGWFNGDAWDDGIVIHTTSEIELGGGSTSRGSQFQGSLSSALLGGYRFPVGKKHGPFIRGGIDLRATGNDTLYHSLLELPRADLGWHFLEGKTTTIDLAATAGLALIGRHDFGNGERTLDIAFVNGATATVKVGPLRFFGIWTHVTPRSAGGGVDWLEGAFCAGPKGFALCTRGGLFGGDVIDRAGNVRNAYAIQIGWTLAFKQKF